MPAGRCQLAQATYTRGVLDGDLSVAEDVSPGNWIGPRLAGDFGAVTLAVPDGFAAYARICHPATDPENKPVTWPEVARVTGRVVHPVMQWHALVGSPDPFNFTGSLWSGQPPDRGNLARPLLESLCELLADYTTQAAHCFFGLWIGWSWVEQGVVLTTLGRTGAEHVRPTTEFMPSPFSTEELSRPRLRLPHREYLLLTGPLSAATKIHEPGPPSLRSPQSPNLFWPADRTWCVASEIDFDSTLVGGPTDLIQAILNTPQLDAWPVRPEDSLACDADQINHIPK